MTAKKILIMDNDARETINMDTERIVNWMGQGKDSPMFDAAFAQWDAIEATVETGDVAALELVLRTIDDTVRVQGVPDKARCGCGYSWTPRTPEPKSCPRCKRRLD